MYPHERSLVKELAKTKRFVLLGINSDSSPAKLREVLKREEITWPILFDGGGTGGPIATRWGVRAWPTIYVLDATGVIRFEGPRDEALTRAVKQLLEEAKAARR